MSIRQRLLRNACLRGFFLIEAMVSFAIMSVGLLALAGMQISLSRNADVSKQRVEAMRLAQQRIETMRSFTHIAPVATTPDDPDRNGNLKLAWNSLGSDTDKNNPLQSANFSNATFRRTWTVDGLATDAMRPISATVKWTDRAGTPQTVTLNSVISQSDPGNAAALGFPLPDNTNLKLPKNRMLNIPVPAVDVGGGKSAYQIASGMTIVFSNLTANVVQKCTGQVTASTYGTTAAGCSSYDAYIVAGYVSGAISNTSGTPAVPSGVNSNGVSFYSASGRTISCTYAIAKDVSTGANIPTSHYYLCLIPVAPANGTWSGTIRLGGIPTTGDYEVCRFEYPGSSADTPAQRNDRNIQPYVNVTSSIDNQNYIVATNNDGSCPVVGGLQTVLHQDCRASQAPTAANCPPSSANTPAN